jgi:hypothetical protein
MFGYGFADDQRVMRSAGLPAGPKSSGSSTCHREASQNQQHENLRLRRTGAAG